MGSCGFLTMTVIKMVKEIGKRRKGALAGLMGSRRTVPECLGHEEKHSKKAEANHNCDDPEFVSLNVVLNCPVVISNLPENPSPIKSLNDRSTDQWNEILPTKKK